VLRLERLKECLQYDPSTGLFTWLKCNSARAQVGATAGTTHTSGYVIVSIDRETYRAHRLAWFYMTGEWPRGFIDHRNTIRDDNRWGNLRDVSSFINQQNRRGPNRNNKSGLMGVSWATRGGWFARIYSNGKPKYLGYFETPELAHKAYLQAKAELHECSPVG
jgi:hypothetical protein